MRLKDLIAVWLNALFILFLIAIIARWGTPMVWFWTGMDLAALLSCCQLAET